MDRTVEALLSISLQAAAIGAAIALFRAALGRHMSPRLQYGLWFILAARLLLPVDVPVGFHFDSLLPERPAVQAAQAEPTPAPAPAYAPAHRAETPELGPYGQAGTNRAPAYTPPQPAPAEPAAPASTDWREAAFWAWIAGVMAFMGWLSVVKVRYCRRMEAARMEAPEYLAGLYEECRAGLGVKAGIPIWVVDAAMSPGITIFDGPVLLLPADMLDSPHRLRYALLHELAHLKRRDHITNELMTLLRGIYWFNPAVHLALNEMAADMETACDAVAMAALSQEDKRGYLTTIIDLFSREAMPQLGMGQLGGQRMIKRRLRGAFMRGASTTWAKLGAGAMALALAVCCFTTACQPSPASPASAPAPGSTPEPIPTAEALPPQSAAEYLVENGLRSTYTLRIPLDADGYDMGVGNLFDRIAPGINACAAVQPGEEWSFNRAMGVEPMGEEGGYSTADGWLMIPGELPGLDWAANALYCALLSGGIEVTEYTCHAWPQEYAEPGMDVSVSSNMDLKFRNNTGSPLALHMALYADNPGGLDITVDVQGEPISSEVAYYALRSQVVETIPMGAASYVEDPALPEGLVTAAVEGREGYVVNVYRDAVGYDGVGQAPGELLYTCTYREHSPVYAVGAGSATALPDLPDAELAALVDTCCDFYRFDSSARTIEAAGRHYAGLERLLKVQLGDIALEDQGIALTVGLPREAAGLNKRYPYIALLFALDRGLDTIHIGVGLGQGAEDTLSISRTEAEILLAPLLDGPLERYGDRPNLLMQLIPAAAEAALPEPAQVKKLAPADAIHRLARLGYLGGPWEGSYDHVVKQAVMAFQRQYGIEADGVIGEETYRAIMNGGAPQPAPAAGAVPEGLGSAVLAAAKAQLGKPYRLGAAGPESFDASGLIYCALNQAGLGLPRLSCEGYSVLEGYERIEGMDGLEAGDLLFFLDDGYSSIGHAGIYAGDDKMVDASSANGKVVARRVDTTYWRERFSHGLRLE